MVIAITFLTLVIELVPKRIALSNPERIAAFVAPMMKLLAKIGRPAVRLLGFSTDVLLSLLRIKHSSESPVTEEEIKLLIEQGTQGGVFQQSEQDI